MVARSRIKRPNPVVAQFDFRELILYGVIPSAAAFQAERGISQRNGLLLREISRPAGESGPSGWPGRKLEFKLSHYPQPFPFA
jgi:hypothetical protein